MGSRQNKHGKGTENYQNVARVSTDRKQFAFLSSYLDTKSCVTWVTVVVIQGPQSALLDKSDYRWENDSYVISIALEWHEAIKTRREQAFRIREPELRVREQENKPGTGELIITCVYSPCM